MMQSFLSRTLGQIMWPWEDLAYKLLPKAPQKKRWTRQFDNILPQVFESFEVAFRFIVSDVV
jgi:hypothetical protein